MIDLALASLFGAVAVDNAVLGRLAGVDRALDDASVLATCRIGLLTILVTSTTAAAGWLVARGVLLPWGLQGFRGVATIILAALIAAGLAWLQGHGPLRGWQVDAQGWLRIAVNSVVLTAGVGMFAADLSFLAHLLRGVGIGAGFLLVSVLLNAMAPRLDDPAIAGAFRGVPIRLLSLGLMALGFAGLAGLAAPA